MLAYHSQRILLLLGTSVPGAHLADLLPQTAVSLLIFAQSRCTCRLSHRRLSLHLIPCTYCRGHFYPGTGGVDEVGEGAGEGYSVNVPWPMGGMGNGDYMAAFNHVIMPIAYEYQPDLIIISAGFDASIGDPIGG